MDINLALKKLERDDNNYRLSTNADDSSATIVFWDSNNSDPQPSVGDLQQAWTDYQNDIEPNYNTDKSNPRHVVLTETTYECTGTVLDPANGTVQYKTLSGNVTFTEVLEDGQSLFLRISTSGSNEYSVTFPANTKFLGGFSPAISKDDQTLLEIFKVGSTLYVAKVGDFKTP